MTVCHIFVLVFVTLVVFGAAACLARSDERSARFKEECEREDEERILKSDLP